MKALLLSILLAICVVAVPAQDDITPIHVIQGTEYLSPKVGKEVTTKGVVTALRRKGFYIQVPTAEVDNDPMTSEGVYVYTDDEPPKKLKVGDAVEVKGTVAEFRPNSEPYALFLTEIVNPKVEIISSGNPLPPPVRLTKEILSPAGNPDQLEKFEGMRVTVTEMTVVAPTGGRYDKKTERVVTDGVFYGVIGDTPRPFREPGLDVLAVLLGRAPRTVPVFDGNPELIRVDSDGLNGGVPIDVTSEAKIRNIAGVLDYVFRSYTIMMDGSVTPTIAGLKSMVPTSPAKENEVTVASFNLENFFDDEKNSKLRGNANEQIVPKKYFEKRLKKASLAIRTALSSPDVLGVVEVENKKVLEKLAARVNKDAASSGGENPEYVAYLEESNDIRGIDVGFLIKSKKIKVTGSEQLAKKLKHDHKDAHPEETLFSRPPFLIEAEAKKKDGTVFAFTVIVNHFKSYRGIDDPKSGDRVRNKKRGQAEFLAKAVSERQNANPDEKILIIGDFNSFQFNDGYNDLIGTLKGKPERRVLVPPTEIFETGLVNLVDYISVESRYSYIFGGSAQVLDHVLVNRAAVKFAKKFGYARFNADFPKVYSNDPNRPERVSDHDVPVVFLEIEPSAQ